MSGNIFKVEEKEVLKPNRAQFNEIGNLVCAYVRSLGAEHALATKSPIDKNTFGDVDIIVSGIDLDTIISLSGEEISTGGEYNVKLLDMSLNDTTVSYLTEVNHSGVCLGKVPVDIILVDNFDFAMNYYSYAPMSIVAGIIAKQIFGLNLTPDGLVVPNFKGSTESIIIHDNWISAMRFIGYTSPRHYTKMSDDLVYDWLFNYIIENTYASYMGFGIKDVDEHTRAMSRKLKNGNKSASLTLFKEWCSTRFTGNEFREAVMSIMPESALDIKTRKHVMETIDELCRMHTNELNERAHDLVYARKHLKICNIADMIREKKPDIGDINLADLKKALTSFLLTISDFNAEKYSSKDKYFYKSNKYDYLYRHLRNTYSDIRINDHIKFFVYNTCKHF